MDNKGEQGQESERNHEDIEYVKRYVAFLDILGFRKMVESDEPEKMIALLDLLLKQTLEYLKKRKQDGLTYRLFSDCICISAPETAHGLFDILLFIAFFQTVAFIDGVFLRGGLSIGKHYETEQMIFSKVLVDAYELQKEAFYPLVIVDERIVKHIETIDSSAEMFIGNAPDRMAFVDYLFLASYDNDGGAAKPNEYLQKHKEQILKQLMSNCSDPNIVAKYMWLADYHNHKCNQFFEEKPDLADRSLLIDRSELPQFAKLDIA